MNQVRIALVLLLLSPGAAFAKAPKAPTWHYLAEESVDVFAAIPGPPDIRSAKNKAEIAAVLERQKTRTAADIARARWEEEPSPADFDPVLGRRFNAVHFPATFALLENAASDAANISESAKKYWGRPRPPLQNLAIHPVVPVPSSASYPSGHAIRGMVWAIILAKLDPAEKAALMARGAQIGDDRIMAGVHFPTDVADGQRLGRFIAAQLLANPRFKRDFRLAKTEFTPAAKYAGGIAFARFALN
jgi:hypothetical protein